LANAAQRVKSQHSLRILNISIRYTEAKSPFFSIIAGIYLGAALLFSKTGKKSPLIPFYPKKHKTI